MDADERPSPYLPVLLAWLVPGAGHLKIGKLWPGVFVFTAILPLYVGGMALTGFENVSPVRHQYYFWALHVFGGVLTGAAALATKHVERSQYMPYQSTGELFTALACLMNVIAMSDVWSRCARGDPEARAKAREAAAAPQTPSSVAPASDAPSPATSTDHAAPQAEETTGG